MNSNEENLLLPAELETLWQCEDEIRHGLAAYLRVAEALHTIQQQRLYREDFPNFAAYCHHKWNLTDRHARNMANAWEIATDLNEDPIANAESLPQNERQARELKQVPRERRAEVWEQAVALAGGVQHVCAHDVKSARELLIESESEVDRWNARPSTHETGAAGQTFEREEEIVVITQDPANHAARIINKYGGQYAAQLIHELDRILTEKGM